MRMSENNKHNPLTSRRTDGGKKLRTRTAHEQYHTYSYRYICINPAIRIGTTAEILVPDAVFFAREGMRFAYDIPRYKLIFFESRDCGKKM